MVGCSLRRIDLRGPVDPIETIHLAAENIERTFAGSRTDNGFNAADIAYSDHVDVDNFKSSPFDEANEPLERALCPIDIDQKGVAHPAFPISILLLSAP
jgi:hypothetical protein